MQNAKIKKISPGPGLSYLPNHQVLIENIGQDSDAFMPDTVIKKDKKQNIKVATWGDKNDFPQKVVETVRKNSIIPAAIDWKVRAIYGGGLEYGFMQGDNFVKQSIPEVDEFIKMASPQRYAIAAAMDFYYFFNHFPQLILSRDRKKIVNIQRIKAVHCRYQKKAAGDLYPQKCFIHGDWAKTSADKAQEEALQSSVINADVDPINQVADGDDFKYIYPSNYADPLNDYYASAPWHSLLKGGWISVANSIPAFKKAVFDNQLAIKYHIKIPSWYWSWRFKDFDTLEQKERNDRVRKVHDEINTMLSSERNAGKSILTHRKLEGNQFSGIEIEVLNTRFGDKMYIEDSAEASNHILFAMGLDPALIGNAPGSKMGAGSGSDKLVAFNIYKALQKINIDQILEPLEFIGNYNGWDPRLKWRFKNMAISRQDEAAPVNPDLGA
jgi:hypothetical protein